MTKRFGEQKELLVPALESTNLRGDLRALFTKVAKRYTGSACNHTITNSQPAGGPIPVTPPA